MAANGSASRRPDVRATVPLLGAVLALVAVLLATCVTASGAGGKATPASPSVTRQRRSDDYDNMDNFLMGSSDYDNFFLKTAKSVPRIGRRSGGEDPDQTPLHMDRRSTDMNELVPSYAHGYDHFFLKAAKSVPRIGKRNDEFFMKTAKSVPRIGRRSGDGPDNFLQKGKDQSEFLKTTELQPPRSALLEAVKPHRSGHQVERRSRVQVEEGDWPAHDSLGGNDAVLGRQLPHRIQRRNYDELMAKAAKTVPRMGKRMHLALDEVGDWGTEQPWPWFRQQDTSPGPNKRVNPADLIDLSEVPWDSVDAILRHLEARRGLDADDKHLHDVILLEGDVGDSKTAADEGDRWAYSVGDKKGDAGAGTSTRNKELEEARFQPDVKKKKKK